MLVYDRGGDVITTTEDSVQISLVLKEKFYITLEKLSEAEGRNIDAWINYILWEHFDAEKREEDGR